MALFTQTSMGPSSRSTRCGGGFDGIGIGDVALQDNGLAAALLDVTLRALERFLPAREQADMRAFAFRKKTRGRAPNSGRGAGDDNDSGFLWYVYKLFVRLKKLGSDPVAHAGNEGAAFWCDHLIRGTPFPCVPGGESSRRTGGSVMSRSSELKIFVPCEMR